MKRPETMLIVVLVTAVIAVGCVAPTIGVATKSGDTIWRIEVVPGDLVKTIQLDDGQTVNFQVTPPDTNENDYAGLNTLLNTLTVGKFSPVFGSGFTRKSNIYYCEEISHTGRDTFNIGDTQYRMSWNYDITGSVSHFIYTPFVITIVETSARPPVAP